MSLEKKEVCVVCNDEKNLPLYASAGASGADVYANVSENFVLGAGESALIPTGLFFEIPEGYEIQVRPRSGLALKHQITVLNTPGTIDSDYRGELNVILINHGKQNFIIEPKMRIAHIVLAKVVRAEFVLAEALSLSERGAGGFGHTGRY